MKIKLLLVSAIAIVGMAVYTLTLSFTNTTPLIVTNWLTKFIGVKNTDG